MKKSVEGLSSRVKSLEENSGSSNTEGKACIKCPKELSVTIVTRSEKRTLMLHFIKIELIVSMK